MTHGQGRERPVGGSRLSWGSVVGYGAGDLGNGLTFSLLATFLVLYYTDVAGITPAAAATLILVVRFWDAIADLFAGQLVDRTMTRFGKFRPYILYCTVPLVVLTVLCFSVPSFLSYDGRLVWAYLTYAGVGLAYSLVNIPYGSLAAAMTKDPQSRARLASARTIGSAIALFLITVALSNRVEAHRHDRGALGRDFTVATICFGALALVMYWLLFRTSRERVERDEDRVALRQSLSVLRHHRPLVLLCLASLIFQAALYTAQALAIYYARDVLGDANYMGLLGLVAGAGIAVDAALVGWVVRAWGKKRGFLVLGSVGVIGAGLLFLAPAGQLWAVVAAWFVCQTGLFGVTMLLWAMEADTVDYGEWRMGYRTEGLTYALFSFMRKLGQAIGGALGAAVLVWFGYVANAPHQSDAALRGIRAGVALVPALLVLVSLAVMLFYPLTDEKFRRVVAEVEERRHGHGGEPAPAPPAGQSGGPQISS